jgi:site-specific DNA-methyltransferase (adenine-specific)
MSQKAITKNTLFYGDNLPILREHIADESIDLIYLDPPFNSSRNYNVLFKDESGHEAEAQITAFEDTWHWNNTTEETYNELVTVTNGQVGSIIGALRQSIGANQMMAYLVMMASRLVELHRVLKPTGSLYIHCDPTASHYLKVVLDNIFEPKNFLSEIIWKRTSAHSSARRPGPVHDVILLYAKSEQYVWNKIFQPYSEEYEIASYSNQDADGRRWKSSDITGAGTRNGETGEVWRNIDVTAKGRHWAYPPEELDRLDTVGKVHWPSKVGGMPRLKQYLDEMPGLSLQDIWTDIDPIGAQAAERLGYPTQKPVALLERIVNASSNPGDIVLDPFCGCGTTIAAAQKLGRRWVGIDVTNLSIALQKYRLKDAFNLEEKKDYVVIGEPEDLESARQLANDDRYQFQWWALSLIKARPLGGETGSKQGKKGSDAGIDGLISFIDEASGKPKRVLVQVKSGKVKSGDVRDLRGTLEREGAAIGIFITLEKPSRDMITEAASAGLYHSPGWNKDYPKLQIFTIADLLEGADVKMPPAAITFKKAVKETNDSGQQDLFDL